jgi:death-on-curing protein
MNLWSYEPEADLAALAASYAYGLAKNHGFVDGNKRIGFGSDSLYQRRIAK